MKRPCIALLAAGSWLSAWSASAVEPVTISDGNLAISVQADAGTVAFSGAGQRFAQGRLRGAIAQVARESVSGLGLGAGTAQGLRVTYTDGGSDTLMLVPGVPFALVRPRFANPSTQPVVLNRIPVLTLDLDLGIGPATTFGTGGLAEPETKPGSYAWLAVVHPATRDGIVAGWISQEHACGVITAGGTKDHPTIEGRTEYGRLPIAAGAQADGELYAVGRFADARLGLEAWADAVARHQGIRLNPQPVVYCTWYDNIHGGSGNAASIAELSAFAAQELKPYGFSCVQIDDGWQLGVKGNGPKKVFTGHLPTGPFPAGMKPTADGITTGSLTAGLWLLPFGGTWNDPFFAAHQDWFVARQDDGKPFDTAWGGTCLDMTHPGARSFVAGEITQIVHDWGYRYLKLDGLSTGCGVKPQYVNAGWKEDDFGNATFHDPQATNTDAFRGGLRLIRENAGADTFILGCCAAQNMRSYSGAFGLVDAMRTGPDNSGSWHGWLSSSPLFGTRHHHLHGRIWYNDPDPIYVRPSIALDSARAMASWNALAGHMVSFSDWLPGLPPERLDILKRVIPSHQVTARAADLFQAQPQKVWTVQDNRPDHPRRDVVGLFNWGAKPEVQTVATASLDLPAGDRYIAYDFWNDTFLPPFSTTLETAVPAQGCRVLAVHPLLRRPFVLSSSRHVTQGILDIRQEAWDEGARTLTVTSDLIAGDAYEARLVARDGEAAYALTGVAVSPADQAAGVTITSTARDGLIRVALRGAVGRTVTWTARFAPAQGAPALPTAPTDLAWKPVLDQETVAWSWNAGDGTSVEVVQDGAPPQMAVGRQITWHGLEPEKTYRFRFTAVDWAGRRSPSVEQTLTMPKGQPMPASLPAPTVALTSLTPSTVAIPSGHLVANMSRDGGPIQIAGEARSTGLGVSAPAALTYEVKPEWRRFVALAGIDDEVKTSKACVVFRVIGLFGDGKKRKERELAVSPKIRAGTTTPFWRFDVALPKGVSGLRLVADHGEDQNPDNHADWADAGFLER